MSSSKEASRSNAGAGAGATPSSRRLPPQRTYELLACPAFHDMAVRMQAAHPERFTYHATEWEKFGDGTDKIELGGFAGGRNHLRGRHVLFLASFHNNDVTLSQFHALVVLLESFVTSLTVFLPFYPTATMERVVREGVIATASTLARLLNALPSCGPPTCLVVYDMHTLQNRFYLAGHCLPQLETSVPLLHAAWARLREGGFGDGSGGPEGGGPGEVPVDAVAFPDDGAAKRFGALFPGYPAIVCGKVRGEGGARRVTVQDGDPGSATHVVIVDDLVQTGGTLFECARALKAQGAGRVSAFCAHAVFPNDSWRRFLRNGGGGGGEKGSIEEGAVEASSRGASGDRAVFSSFWVTNSVPTTVQKLPKDDAFVVLDLMPQLCVDLA